MVTDGDEVTPPWAIVNVAGPGIRHWNVALTVLVAATVSASSVTVTVAPRGVATSPLLGATLAVVNWPTAGLAVRTALLEPAGVSSVYIAVTWVELLIGTMVKVTV